MTVRLFGVAALLFVAATTVMLMDSGKREEGNPHQEGRQIDSTPKPVQIAEARGDTEIGVRRNANRVDISSSPVSVSVTALISSSRTGNPVEGAELQIDVQGHRAKRCYSDSDGLIVAELESLSEVAVFTIKAAGFYTEVFSIGDSRWSFRNGDAFISLELKDGGCISGRVITIDGSPPPPDTAVLCLTFGESYRVGKVVSPAVLARFEEQRAQVTESGHFSLDGVGVGVRYALNVISESHELLLGRSARAAFAGDEDVEIVIAPVIGVTLDFIDSNTGLEVESDVLPFTRIATFGASDLRRFSLEHSKGIQSVFGKAEPLHAHGQHLAFMVTGPRGDGDQVKHVNIEVDVPGFASRRLDVELSSASQGAYRRETVALDPLGANWSSLLCDLQPGMASSGGCLGVLKLNPVSIDGHSGSMAASEYELTRGEEDKQVISLAVRPGIYDIEWKPRFSSSGISLGTQVEMLAGEATTVTLAPAVEHSFIVCRIVDMAGDPIRCGAVYLSDGHKSAGVPMTALINLPFSSGRISIGPLDAGTYFVSLLEPTKLPEGAQRVDLVPGAVGELWFVVPSTD